jgi:hypothetical protein
MAGIIKATIAFVLSNYSLSFLVIGLLFSLAAIVGAKASLKSSDIVEKLISWHVFWAIGVG